MKKKLVGRLTAQEMTAMALAATARVVPPEASAYAGGALAPRNSMDRPRGNTAGHGLTRYLGRVCV